MSFTEISKWKKWYLKYTNKPAYRAYKKALQQWNLEEYRRTEKEKKAAVLHQHTQQISRSFQAHKYKSLTSFKHSGNSGDIIYSLPAVFELSKNGKANLYLHINQAGDFQDSYHPLGGVMLNQKMVDLLRPLLLFQPQIEQVNVYNGEAIDYNLDEFRDYIFFLDRGSLVRSYLTLQGIQANTALPWLIAPKDERYAQTIVIARSHRYRSPVADYSFLNKYPDKIFVGVPEEYEDMKKSLPELKYQPVKDFLELATIINSCRFFIGNQSFPFALAEALKVQRLLEVFFEVPNVVVEGEGANDFLYQPQFEYVTQRLFEETEKKLS